MTPGIRALCPVSASTRATQPELPLAPALARLPEPGSLPCSNAILLNQPRRQIQHSLPSRARFSPVLAIEEQAKKRKVRSTEHRAGANCTQVDGILSGSECSITGRVTSQKGRSTISLPSHSTSFLIRPMMELRIPGVTNPVDSTVLLIRSILLKCEKTFSE